MSPFVLAPRHKHRELPATLGGRAANNRQDRARRILGYLHIFCSAPPPRPTRFSPWTFFFLPFPEISQQDWEVEQRRTARIEDEEYDRGFYLRDDGGGAVEDSETANPFLGDEKKFAAKEAENAKLRCGHTPITIRNHFFFFPKRRNQASAHFCMCVCFLEFRYGSYSYCRWERFSLDVAERGQIVATGFVRSKYGHNNRFATTYVRVEVEKA